MREAEPLWIPIVDTTQNFNIDSWDRCQFINVGNVPVTIMGVRLEKKDSVRLGGEGYVVKKTLSISFDANPRNQLQKVICIYEKSFEKKNDFC